MNQYTPTEILPGDTGLLREHSFTAWLQLEHLQAATDFALTIGLLPIYAEHQNRNTGRYLFWSPPAGMEFEVRSGRTETEFGAYDEVAATHGLQLLSLHISADDLYSAVWVSAGQIEIATAVLRHYGLTRAQRPSAP